MGHEEFMSQEEVDALLKGVTGESDSEAEQADRSGVRPYNIATQERIVRGRMPGLEIINDRFARLLRVGIFNFMRRTAEISVGPVKVLKYSEFTRNLPIPTNLNLVHVKPLRGTSLFVFDPNLVFFVVDNLFGGDGRFHTRVEGRDFTATEQRIISKLLNLVFEHYTTSWKSVRPLQFEFVRSEMHTQFANVATPNEIVIVTQFSIEFGTTGGTLHICMPYSMIEPIRDILSSPIQGEARRSRPPLGARAVAAGAGRGSRTDRRSRADPDHVRADPEHAQRRCAADQHPRTHHREGGWRAGDGMRLRYFQWSICVAGPENDQRSGHDEGRWI